MKYNKENFDTMLLNLDEALPHRIDETGDEDKNSIIAVCPLEPWRIQQAHAMCV